MNTEQRPIYSGFSETTTANEVILARDLTSGGYHWRPFWNRT